MQGSSLGLQIAVVAGIALLMTVGVYGLVGLIVKLDDIGLHLLQGLNDRIGTTIVMVTHDQRAAGHAHAIMHLEKGLLSARSTRD